ncbi:site-specific integrase [Vagococcus fluvialis]|uniref:site-specific integrase n=1 Tax=Vagococcus fluvialis TaxID=2738 RepID=UPI0037AC06D0
MAQITSYIKKDGSKAYMYKVYLGIDPITGKEKRTTRRNFNTKKEAQISLSRLLLDVEKNGLQTNNITSNIKTFNQLYELWFKQHSKDIKNTTIQRIEQHFNNHILPKMGDMSLNKISPLYCQECLNEWAEKLATYKQLKTYVNMVFKYGILIGVIGDNPMSRTITPKQKNKAPVNVPDSFYTKSELKQFFDCLEKLNDKRAYAFFRVLAFLGLRKGECMALLWKDIDFVNRLVTIDKTLVELQDGSFVVNSTKTESSTRTIQMDDKTTKILREWKNHIIREKFALGIREDNFSDNVVFCNSVFERDRQYLYKAYPNHVMDKVKKHFPKMKIIKVHDFRKTNASLLFESGASIKDVSQRLGHKNTKVTTDIYVMVTPTKQKETVELFSSYMNF